VALPLLMAMALIPMKNNKQYLAKSDMGLWAAISQSTPETVSQNKEENMAEYTANTVTPEAAQLKYFIVGGSFKSEENATKYLQQLSEQGYSGKDLGIFKGLHRVAMKGFASMEEAQKELNAMRYQNPESGVWIHVN